MKSPADNEETPVRAVTWQGKGDVRGRHPSVTNRWAQSSRSDPLSRTTPGGRVVIPFQIAGGYMCNLKLPTNCETTQ